MSDTAPDFSAFPDSSILIGQRLVMKRGGEVYGAGRVVKVTTVFTEDGSASLGETDTGGTFTIGDYPTPPSADMDDEPEEMRHCDGCGEDYNAFKETHIGHEGATR